MEQTKRLRRFEVRDMKTGMPFIVSELQRVTMRKDFEGKLVGLPGPTWFEFSDGSAVLKRIDENMFQVTNRRTDSFVTIGQLFRLA